MSNIDENMEIGRAALISQLTRTNDYRCLNIDMSVARPAPGAAQGLITPGFKYRSIMILRNDRAFIMRLNTRLHDPIPIPAGLLITITNHDFEEIFIENTAGVAGNLVTILITYNRTESQAVK